MPKNLALLKKPVPWAIDLTLGLIGYKKKALIENIYLSLLALSIKRELLA